jgi:hypothetical protein
MSLTAAQEAKTSSAIIISEKLLSSLRINGLNSDLEAAAKCSICNEEGIYVIRSTNSGTNYGVVFLEKYMSGLSDEDKLLRGVSQRHSRNIVRLMDGSLRAKEVSGWIILRYRSGGREFLGFYEGQKNREKIILR